MDDKMKVSIEMDTVNLTCEDAGIYKVQYQDINNNVIYQHNKTITVYGKLQIGKISSLEMPMESIVFCFCKMFPIYLINRRIDPKNVLVFRCISFCSRFVFFS